MRHTIIDFITKSHKIHKGRYDYSLVDYVNSKTKVSIICKDHGVFDMAPCKHYAGQNCPKCNPVHLGKDFIRNKLLENSLGRFRIMNLSDINTVHDRVECECILCEGITFKPKAGKMLSSGSGCRGCCNKRTLYIEDFTKIHHGFYDYSKFNPVRSHVKSVVTCPVHGDFKIAPTHHLSGRGCNLCALTKLRFDSNTLAERRKSSYEKEKCSLYIAKVGSFIKIGISKDTKERMKDISRESELIVDVLHEFKSNRYDCLMAEKQLHDSLVTRRPETINKFAGYTECFLLSEKEVEDLVTLINLPVYLK